MKTVRNGLKNTLTVTVPVFLFFRKREKRTGKWKRYYGISRTEHIGRKHIDYDRETVIQDGNTIHVTTQRNIVLTANKERILEPPWSRLLLRTALHISSQHMHMHTENQKFRTAKPRHTHATCIRHIDTAVHHTGTGPIAHVHPSPYSPFQVVEMRPWRSGRSSMRWNWTEQLVAECQSLGSMGPGGLWVVAVGSRWAAECRVDGRGPGHLGRRGGGGV